MPQTEHYLSRSGNRCEICGSTDKIALHKVQPEPKHSIDNTIVVCPICLEGINDSEKINPHHFRCLNDSMWSTIPAVQVVAYRLLRQMQPEGWPNDLLDMLYLDEETKKWAEEGLQTATETIVHKDSNGAVLEAGDTVVLTQDLNVKGASFTAKRGTAVRRISLVHDNPEYIEGKVDGQQIVILTKYVKKSK